jgi:prephenate dehydrogenase
MASYGFLGLGLIGGSLAKAMKKYLKNIDIIAFDTDITSLNQAQEEGTIDRLAHTLSELYHCDYLFLCCPVQINIAYLKELAPYINKDCIVTDVGSTKEDIMSAVSQLPDALRQNINFIGGHPMTGSEKSGYRYADARLLENAYYLLTPQPNLDVSIIDRFTQLILKLQGLPLVMDASKHDYVMASISHVPHVIASALVNTVANLDDEANHMHTLAAGGFRDITRIASASPTMWQQISLTNQVAIIDILSVFIEELQTFTQKLKAKQSEATYLFYEKAKDYRNSFQSSTTSLLPQQHQIRVDVADEPGIIAKVATLLSHHQINIKNIGIINNREETEGVLQIIFSDSESQNKSIDVLIDLGFNVYS